MDAITELRRQLQRPPTLTARDGGALWTGMLIGLLEQHHARGVFEFQHKAGITADGICGPQTWSHLAKRDDSPHERTIQGALFNAYRGAREEGGNNRGPFVRAVAGREGQPWCVKFATYCYNAQHKRQVPDYFHAGSRAYYPTWSSSGLVEWAKAHRCLTMSPGVVRPGCFVVVRGGPTKFKHTALLLDYDPAKQLVYVAEGNVRPRKWLPWQYDVVRTGVYPLKAVVFVDPEVA